MNWFKGLKAVWKLVVVLATALFLFLAYNFVDDFFSKEDEVKAEISQNQADAAVESGKDAVNTVTNQYTKEIERTETVRVIQNEVNNAKDFHSAHAAGASGLCDNFGVCSQEQVQQPDS
jgi:type 1 glutamine amidotransferase